MAPARPPNPRATHHPSSLPSLSLSTSREVRGPARPLAPPIDGAARRKRRKHCPQQAQPPNPASPEALREQVRSRSPHARTAARHDPLAASSYESPLIVAILFLPFAQRPEGRLLSLREQASYSAPWVGHPSFARPGHVPHIPCGLVTPLAP
jgi:hypothetical protein